MKYKDEDPDNLGGLGDMLPAEVLKKLNELLELLHQADNKQQGSTVINIYEKGSLHVDHVDNSISMGTMPLTPLPLGLWTLAASGTQERARGMERPYLKHLAPRRQWRFGRR